MVFHSYARNGAALALVPLLGFVGATAAAAAAPAAKPDVTTIVGFQTSPGSVRVGGALWDSVSVQPRAERAIAVQYRRAGQGRFVTGSTGRSSSSGAFVAQLKPRAAGTWQVRLLVPATPSAAQVVSGTRVVHASGHAATTTFQGFDATPATVAVGGSVVDGVTVRPGARRVVFVQARRPGGQQFATVSTLTSSKSGDVHAVYRPSGAGAWAFRLLVRASPTAQAATSPTRIVTVSGSVPTPTPTPTQVPVDVAPGPVRSVNAVSTTSTSITLSWTNPTDADFAGVIIRRAVGPTPPASATAGTAVTATAAITKSFKDAGLTPGTTYSYALFAFDTAQNISAGVAASAKTGAPTTAVLSINGSTGPTAKETRKEAPFIDLSATHAALGEILTSGLLDYGDGTTQSFVGDPALWVPDGHAYATISPPSFRVTWSVTDSAGTIATTHTDVQVFAPSSVRIATQVGGTFPSPAAVTFDVTPGITVGTEATSYDLFSTNADGTFVTGSEFGVAGAPPGVVTLLFDTPGTYTVELDVDTDAGGLATDTTTVIVT